MKKKKLYHVPTTEITKLKPASIIQTSSEIPDAGWGAKWRGGDSTSDDDDNIIF